MEFRNASPADLEAEFAVFVAAQEELTRRRGSDWSRPQDDGYRRWVELHRHVLRHDGQRAFVAEEAGRIVGFTAALARDDAWFLSALFVAPDQQGRGIGRQLLELAWGGEHTRRITITDALQPVSNGLYAGRGLMPTVPVLALSGEPRIAPTVWLEPATPTGDQLRSLDLAAYGFDRSVDHAFWKETSEATVWLREHEPVAYSYQTPFGIGPLAGRDPESAVLALRAELRRFDGARAELLIPASARALVETAVAAGLRFGDPGLLLVSPAVQAPPTALVIHSYWLY